MMAFDWKPMALCLFGMVLGIYAGMQLNIDAQAHGQAIGMCNTTMANLNTMIENFNVMARDYMPKSECQLKPIGNETRWFNVS